MPQIYLPEARKHSTSDSLQHCYTPPIAYFILHHHAWAKAAFSFARSIIISPKGEPHIDAQLRDCRPPGVLWHGSTTTGRAYLSIVRLHVLFLQQVIAGLKLVWCNKCDIWSTSPSSPIVASSVYQLYTTRCNSSNNREPQNLGCVCG
jgi:hypothetical protein